MENKTLYWIAGIVLAVIILDGYNPGLFAVSPSVRSTTYSSNPNVSPGDCWNHKTIISVTQTGRKYKVEYTPGCECEALSSDTLIDSNTIVLLFDDSSTSKLASVTSILNKLGSPVSDFKYVSYYEQTKDSCKKHIENYNCIKKIHIILNPDTWNSYAYPSRDNPSIVIKKKTQGVIAHELAHVFGLPDAYWGDFTVKFLEYKNNLMNNNVLKSNPFTTDQIKLININTELWNNNCESNTFEGKDECRLNSDSSCTSILCTSTGGKYFPKNIPSLCDCTRPTTTPYTLWINGVGCKHSVRYEYLSNLKSDYIDLYTKLDSNNYR